MRNGEVDRKSYILQRRNLIDAITSKQTNPAEETANPLTETISEIDTIISDTETLASAKNVETDARSKTGLLKLLSLAGVIIIILGALYYFR